MDDEIKNDPLLYLMLLVMTLVIFLAPNDAGFTLIKLVFFLLILIKWFANTLGLVSLLIIGYALLAPNTTEIIILKFVLLFLMGSKWAGDIYNGTTIAVVFVFLSAAPNYYFDGVFLVIKIGVILFMTLILYFVVMDQRSEKAKGERLERERKEAEAKAAERRKFEEIKRKEKEAEAERIRREKVAEAERIRREEERDRPFRQIRKQKATAIFADLLAESRNPLYGEGISYRIKQVMHRLSDFATDHINLTDADLEAAQKTLNEIRSNWKKVEVEGFAEKRRNQEQEENRKREEEEARWEEEREEREYQREIEREERMERERIEDLKQEELLDIERRREKQAELEDIRRRLGYK